MMRRVAWVFFLSFFCPSLGQGQTIRFPFPIPAPASAQTSTASASSVKLTVPKGAPLRVALDKEVSIRKVGERVEGRLVEPVYAFDYAALPAGSQVFGQVKEIDGVSKGKRADAMLAGDFTPLHIAKIEFDELVLPDGRRLPIHTVVTPGTAEVVHLFAGSEKGRSAKDAASQKVHAARQQIRDEWNAAVNQVKAPGKMHRLERAAVASLPYHPQYLEPGTRFDAELEAPLDFGAETKSSDALSALGTPPPAGSVVHALLVTPLSSATGKKDDPVEAVLSQPLFSEDHRLILPEGSKLEGLIVEVHAARRLARNGELRFVFHKLELPNGVLQKVDGNLEGVEVDRGQNLKLDEEGGAHSTTPRTRYLTTAISIALAASAASPDHEHHTQDGGGDPGARGLTGGSGFRLLGAAIGFLIRSSPVSVGFGAYGASRSVYSHFIARGHDVVFPKNTPLEISFGIHRPASAQPQAAQAQPAPGAGPK
jgi:hypothetical protein